MKHRTRSACRASLVVLTAGSIGIGAGPAADPVGVAAPTWRTGMALADPNAEFVPGELIVKFRAGAPEAGAGALRARAGATVLRSFRLTGAEHWRLARGAGVERAIAQLTAADTAGLIEYAEPNFIYSACGFPNDPLRGDLWGLHNATQTGGTLDADIDAPEAWDAQTGSTSVVVGVIDSGTDYTHPDLAANIWTNPGEIAGNGIDDDGNGYVDDTRGWDFVNSDNDPMDDYGHGTHTAGTVGAVGNNGVGVAGVAWNVRLMPLKFLNSSGGGSTAAAIEAIEYAAWFTNGSGGRVVRITNNSWGGGSKSNALKAAIEASGAVFVAAAGNGNTSQLQYPAGYNSANIISVAATDHTDARASFSNYSATWVDLGAPGVNVLSTLPNGQYGANNGTSMAAPHVAGAAALVLSQSPSLTNAQIKSAILNAVDPVASMAGITVTGGRLNAARALGLSPGPSGDTTPPAAVADLAPDTGQTTNTSVALAWTATGDDGSSGMAYAYDLRYSTTPITAANFATATRATGEPLPQAAGSLEAGVVTGLQADTTYYFAITALDESGNASALSNIAEATTTSPPPTPWTVESVDGGTGGGTYVGLAFDAAGNPAVAHNAAGDVIRFTRRVGAEWTAETAISGGPGLSLAYDPLTDQATISHGWGKLHFTRRQASGWVDQLVESGKANNDVTSLVYGPTNRPSIAYRGTAGSGGLKYAYHNGTAWSVQMADAGAGARYSGLCFDGAGNPAIAYSDDINADGWLDTLMVARWTGSAWTTQVADTGPMGYGVHATIAYHPSVGLAAAHRGDGTIRFLRLDAGTGTWVREPIDDTTQYVWGCDLKFAADGTGWLVHSADSVMYAGIRDPLSGAWTKERMEWGFAAPFHVRVDFDAAGRPAAAYAGEGVRYAIRNTESGGGVGGGCYADCGGDGAVTVADLGCFQAKFVAGDPYADCTADGVLSVADFGCFQTRLVRGCP